ncbi:Tau-tubulin kinase 2 [Phlyctochytrium bullatum]|nr:Tau-tubulin kinase 2 [Phlyctochytrium bullatum]
MTLEQLRQLDSGAFGVVYEAEELDPSQQQAPAEDEQEEEERVAEREGAGKKRKASGSQGGNDRKDRKIPKTDPVKASTGSKHSRSQGDDDEHNPKPSKRLKPTLRRVAIKIAALENNEHPFKMIKLAVFTRERGIPSPFPTCLGYGTFKSPVVENYVLCYLVMDLFGKSVDAIQRAQTLDSNYVRKLGPASAAEIGLAMLRALQLMHEAGCVHRDVKPSNMCARYGTDTSDIVVVDLGGARAYVDDNDLRWLREHVFLPCTVYYQSLKCHKYKDVLPVDDLWSLLYSIAELSTGHLAWAKYSKNWKKMVKVKLACRRNPVLLVGKNSPELVCFSKYLTALKESEKPDYDYLEDLLQAMIVRCNGGPARQFEEPNIPADYETWVNYPKLNLLLDDDEDSEDELDNALGTTSTSRENAQENLGNLGAKLSVPDSDDSGTKCQDADPEKLSSRFSDSELKAKVTTDSETDSGTKCSPSDSEETTAVSYASECDTDESDDDTEISIDDLEDDRSSDSSESDLDKLDEDEHFTDEDESEIVLDEGIIQPATNANPIGLWAVDCNVRGSRQTDDKSPEASDTNDLDTEVVLEEGMVEPVTTSQPIEFGAVDCKVRKTPEKSESNDEDVEIVLEEGVVEPSTNSHPHFSKKLPKLPAILRFKMNKSNLAATSEQSVDPAAAPTENPAVIAPQAKTGRKRSGENIENLWQKRMRPDGSSKSRGAALAE